MKAQKTLRNLYLTSQKFSQRIGGETSSMTGRDQAFDMMKESTLGKGKQHL